MALKRRRAGEAWEKRERRKEGKAGSMKTAGAQAGGV